MPNSTGPVVQTQNDDEARRLKLVEALERAQDEVKASRKYIDGLEKQVESKEQIIAAQTKRQTLSDEAITSLQKEIETLKAAVAEQEKTIRVQENETEYLKKELGKTSRKLHRARKLNQSLIIVTAAAILGILFK